LLAAVLDQATAQLVSVETAVAVLVAIDVL
jgi:hypothetical protein